MGQASSFEDTDTLLLLAGLLLTAGVLWYWWFVLKNVWTLNRVPQGSRYVYRKEQPAFFWIWLVLMMAGLTPITWGLVAVAGDWIGELVRRL